MFFNFLLNLNSFDFDLTTSLFTVEVYPELQELQAFLNSFKVWVFIVIFFKLYFYFIFKACTLVLYLLPPVYNKFFFFNFIVLLFMYLLLSVNLNCFKTWFLKQVFYFIFKSFKSFLNIEVNTQILWYYSIWFIFSLFNLISLLPKIPALTSVLLIPVFISFWIFLVNNFKSITILGDNWMNHFFPGKIPVVIAPLLIYIELISYFIRPVSLSVRLFANILSGHILVHILSSYGSLFFNNRYFTLYFIMILVLTILNFLEYFIGLVQSTVFVLISVITQADNCH